jgi:hypothetical protein
MIRPAYVRNSIMDDGVDECRSMIFSPPFGGLFFATKMHKNGVSS